MKYPDKSLGNPIEFHGANDFDPQKTALICGIPLYPLVISLYPWGEHIRKNLYPWFSMVLHGIQGTYQHVLPNLSLCKDMKVGYLVDMKGYLGY